jgi:GNAT superfamily N-acetyltransferase
MMEAEKYSVIELLRNGRPIEIRALRADDRAELMTAISRTSMQSLFRRFFIAKRGFTEQEIAFILDIDFVHHVALVALVAENGRQVIVGGGRYIVVQPDRAEVAFAIVDEYQGKGIGTALMRHLTGIARASGLIEFIAEVLPENTPNQTHREKRLPRKHEARGRRRLRQPGFVLSHALRAPVRHFLSICCAVPQAAPRRRRAAEQGNELRLISCLH